MTGRPSVNVPSEKMQAFLTEVKSAKLKKVSGAMAPPLSSDTSRSALARSLSGTEKGKGILQQLARRRSMTELNAPNGLKRKRDETDTGTDTELGGYMRHQIFDTEANIGTAVAAPKRVATESSFTSDTSTSSIPSTSNFSTNSLFSQVNQTWPSITTTDTDLTSPSLCSDNENEDAAHEDEPPTPLCRPPTPPRRLKKRQSQSRSMVDTPDVDKSLPEIIDVIDDDYGRERQRTARRSASRTPRIESPAQHRASSRSISRTPHLQSPMSHRASSPEDAFAKRPPSSPMPAMVAKKPKPPGRPRAQLRIQPVPFPTDADRSSDQNARPDPEPIAIPTAPPAVKKKQQKSIARAPRTLSQQPTAEDSQEIPLRNSQPSPHDRRRRTLDAEIRRAGDQLWEQENRDGLEHGIMVGVGAKNIKGGFLARGGGAGPSVYMGVGYVQGAEEQQHVARTQRTAI